MNNNRRARIVEVDYRSRFSAKEWIAPLKAAGAVISMEREDRWIDNVLVERLRRSVKHEEVCLRNYVNVAETWQSLSKYFSFYGAKRSGRSTVGDAFSVQATAPGRPFPMSTEALTRDV